MSNEITADPQPLAMQVVAAFEKNETSISDVTKYMELTVEKHGIGKVTAGRVAVKKLRVAIDHRRKELIETALETQRTVNAHAKALTAIVTPVEDYLQSQEDAYEAAKLAIEQEKQRVRRKRLTDRIERLAVAGAVAVEVEVEVVEAMTDEDFEEHLACEEMRVESAREQAEIQRMLAEKQEQDRLAEVARQAEELRIRQEELDRDRKAMAAEREAMLHQQQIERRALEEQQAEIRRQQEEIRKVAELKAEEERQRVIAERLAEDQRLAQIAAEEAEVYRLARLEALKPEIEKAETFGNRLMIHAVEILRVLDQPHWSVEALESVRRCGLEVLGIARGER
jgi:hypothetical protein